MKRFAYLALAVLLVVLAWTGAWYYFAGQVRANIEALAMGAGADGPQFHCDTLAITGFPFRFDADCTQAVLVVGDLMASVPAVRASALIYRPDHVLASARGPAELADAFTGARNRVEWEGLEASLRLADWQRIARLSLVGTELVWTDTLWGDNPIASSPHAELHLLDMPERHDPDAGTSALAGYAQIRALSAPGLDIAAGEVSLEAELTGLPDALADLGDPDALRRWQQADGQLRIVSLRGTDGENFLTSEGELALTPSGMVDGRIGVRSLGVVDQIAPLFPENYGPMLLGNAAPDGSYSQTINIRGGVIMSGILPAGMIPPLF